MARHTARDYVKVVKNSQLVVHWIATVGNYDYFMDYVFSLEGSVEVKVRTSGYIQGAYLAHNSEYGNQIQAALSGSMVRMLRMSHQKTWLINSSMTILSITSSTWMSMELPIRCRR
jgi:Cu2+-containing amine oxidase